MRLLCDRALIERDGQWVDEPSLIEVTDGTITAVETWQSIDDVEWDVDCRGYIVAPAFVNAHTHLAMHGMRGCSRQLSPNMIEQLFFELERNLDAETVKAFAKIGAYESLLTGTAVVWDHYYFADALATAATETGLVAVIAPTLQDVGDGPGVSMLSEQWQLTDSLRGQDEQGIFVALGPHATDTVSDKLWADCLEFASKYDLPCHAHLAQSREEVERSQDAHGCSPVKRLERLGVFERRGLWAHGIFLEPDDFGILAKTNQTIAYCPNSQVQFATPANIRQFCDSEISWVVATDCAATNDTMNVQRELASVPMALGQWHGKKTPVREELLAHYQSIWHPNNLLARISSTPGKLHSGFTAGVIQEGAMANLLLVDPGHPAIWPGTASTRSLVYCDVSPAIHRMMVRGKWLSEAGDHYKLCATSSYRDARDDAWQKLKALINSVDL